MQVIPIPQLSDNYAYLVIDEDTGHAAVVDCAEAEPVIAAVEKAKVELKAILPTHHHYDHVGGNEDLLKRFPVEVIAFHGQRDRIPGCTMEVREGDGVRLGNTAAKVIFIPAHTTGHVAYHFERERNLFTGDTLFAAGCGRLFEGDPAMMMKSLSKLMALPTNTRVYFGHEYSEKNLRFALTLEPGNQALQEKHAWAVEQRRQNLPTTPTTIASEKATNPFVRWDSPELRQTLQGRFPDLPTDDVSVFAKVRALKDDY